MADDDTHSGLRVIEGGFYETLDTAAARVIRAMARTCGDLKVDDKGRAEFGILVLVRAAGWLIGFTPANPDDTAHTERMIDSCCEALRTAASDPLRGGEGEELARVMASFRLQTGR